MDWVDGTIDWEIGTDWMEVVVEGTYTFWILGTGTIIFFGTVTVIFFCEGTGIGWVWITFTGGSSGVVTGIVGVVWIVS